MDIKRHMDQFLVVCDIHIIDHDDVMVIFFLQNLIGPAYEWYLSLPTKSIKSFDDLENMFMTMYAPHVAYHMLFTQFTQIHLKNKERIIYFNMIFFKTLKEILQGKRPNDIIILECYKNTMPTNLIYEIISSQINDLDGAIQKATEMEEFTWETNVDPKIILEKVKIYMNTLSISHQGPSTSINIEN